ncbi:uncharacterized protein LODBEIA_P05430 [Lodderomyces beijingensis]|uniref:Uncharacterized protein n=1 Tax=Lodderomyces beijingensis TaxID=1775926 RepID=A0ABP0ZEL7_9ASCO
MIKAKRGPIPDPSPRKSSLLIAKRTIEAADSEDEWVPLRISSTENRNKTAEARGEPVDLERNPVRDSFISGHDGMLRNICLERMMWQK